MSSSATARSSSFGALVERPMSAQRCSFRRALRADPSVCPRCSRSAANSLGQVGRVVHAHDALMRLGGRPGHLEGGQLGMCG